MKKVLLAVLILTWMTGKSQNLVPNGSFEVSSSCPDNLNELSNATPWFNPTSTSPDYFSTCSPGSPCWAPRSLTGYQYPRTGNAYAGIVVKYAGNYREYLEVPLTTPLTAGTTYMFRMSIVSSDIYQDWTGDVGVYFSTSAVQSISTGPLPFTPQIRNSSTNIPDTLNWMTVTGTFTATGGEQFMVIGNFYDDAHTQYTHANPSAQWNGTYIYVDDVSLTGASTTGINELGISKFSAFPNPANSNSQITFTYPSSNKDRQMVVNDVNGNIAARYTVPAWSSKVILPQMAAGIYVARMEGDGNAVITRFIVE